MLDLFYALGIMSCYAHLLSLSVWLIMTLHRDVLRKSQKKFSQIFSTLYFFNCSRHKTLFLEAYEAMLEHLCLEVYDNECKHSLAIF